MTISASTPSRVVVLLTVISLALVLLLAGAVAALASDDVKDSLVTIESVEHTVHAGDTLWDIASLYTEPGDDVRDTIHDIKQATGLSDSVIRPGDVLVVPVEF